MLIACAEWSDPFVSFLTALIGAAIGACAAIYSTRRTLDHSSGLFERGLAANTVQMRNSYAAQGYARVLDCLAAYLAHSRQVYAHGGKGKGERNPERVEELCGAVAAARLWAPEGLRESLDNLDHDRLHKHLVHAATGNDKWDTRQAGLDSVLEAIADGMEVDLGGRA